MVDRTIRSATYKLWTREEVERHIIPPKVKRREVSILHGMASDDGFVPLRSDAALFGTSGEWEFTNGHKVACSVAMRAYRKPESRAIAALMHATLRVGDTTIVKDVWLVAPDGNLKTVRAFVVSDGVRIRATKFWRSFVRCMKGDGFAGCAKSIPKCLLAMADPTFTAFFSCLAKHCGIAVAMCIACVVCECDRKCKDFFGCCEP